MDQEVLVSDFRKLLRHLQRTVGPVALLMLLAPHAEAEEAWNVVVSAKGFDRKSRADAIGEVIELLRKYVDQRNWHRIIRVTVLKTDDPFVREINDAIRARGSAVNIQSCTFSGIEIPKAILFESQKMAA